jgi:Flp pilus assembly pilin Flp
VLPVIFEQPRAEQTDTPHTTCAARGAERGLMSRTNKLRPRASAASLLHSEVGLSTVEYAIVLVLVVAICIAVFQSFGGKLRASLSGANDEFDKVSDTTY